jgi:hypothetical protein
MKKIACIVIVILLSNLVGCSKINNFTNTQINYKQMYEKLLKDQPPKIKNIKFETPDGKIIRQTEGWYVIGNKVKIIITLEGDCQEVDLFTIPAGSDTYREQKIIDIIVPQNDVAEYSWNVPEDTMEYLQVIAYNKNVGRRSELFNIISHR